MTLDRGEKWATILAAVVTAVALFATAFFSNRTLDTANEALKESRSQGWGVQGAMTCASYREQVQRLWEIAVPKRQIRAWFAAEQGGQHNPHVKGGGDTALEDFESGCGTLDVLLDVLKAARVPAGAEAGP